MKKVIAGLMVGVGLFALLTPPASAAISDYPKAKRERFWKAVLTYEPMVKYAGKKSTIELGVATCDLLRAGGDLYDLSMLLVEADAGIAEDSIVAIIAAAPVILCPDQGYKFD